MLQITECHECSEACSRGTDGMPPQDLAILVPTYVDFIAAMQDSGLGCGDESWFFAMDFLQRGKKILGASMSVVDASHPASRLFFWVGDCRKQDVGSEDKT